MASSRDPSRTDLPATERTRLLTEAYATTANFSARQSIYRYRVPQQNFITWVIDHMPADGFDVVLDAGAGNGFYERALRGRATRVLAVDLSYGMIVDIPRWDGLQLATADITALPVRTGACTGAFANHMLYHVPDIVAAAHELRRVVRPGGALVASTNGARHWDGLVDILQAALDRRDGTTEWPVRPFHRFIGPDDSALLATAFDSVEWEDVHADLVVPDAAPVVAYVASMRSWLEHVIPIPWDDYLAALTDECNAIIAGHGNVTVHTHAGVFVCH